MKMQRRWAMALTGLGLLAVGLAQSSPALAAGDGYSVAQINAQRIAKGSAIFKENCVVCHQADAIGKPGIAPSLANPEFLSIASNKFLDASIRQGRPGTSMAAFGSFLKDEDISAIITYLRAQSNLPYHGEQVDAEPQAMGDPRFGRQWFADICATCHGPTGDGYQSGGTGTAIGKKGFLDIVSDGFLRETIRNGRSNTRMLGFQGADGLANLTDREIDDIIAYLRTVPSKD